MQVHLHSFRFQLPLNSTHSSIDDSLLQYAVYVDRVRGGSVVTSDDGLIRQSSQLGSRACDSCVSSDGMGEYRRGNETCHTSMHGQYSISRFDPSDIFSTGLVANL